LELPTRIWVIGLGLRFEFSNKSEETALREWCAENGIELNET
jgi:hypothetical protein